MALTNPTPTDIRDDFPAFASVGDGPIQRRIDRTASWVDASWLETDYAYAKSLLTAHYLVVDGFGATGDAEIAAYRSAGVSRLKSGTLDVTFTSDESSGDSGGSEFDATEYGRRFLSLLRKNKSGVLTTVVVTGVWQERLRIIPSLTLMAVWGFRLSINPKIDHPFTIKCAPINRILLIAMFGFNGLIPLPGFGIPCFCVRIKH